MNFLMFAARMLWNTVKVLVCFTLVIATLVGYPFYVYYLGVTAWTIVSFNWPFTIVTAYFLFVWLTYHEEKEWKRTEKWRVEQRLEYLKNHLIS